MIDIKDLTFRYTHNGPDVLKGISFKSEENTVISILGPNGTGKTTFLKCMCGVQPPTTGSISVDGKDIGTLSARELSRKIAFVPQSVPVSRLSVFDTVLLGRKPYFELGPTRADIDKVSDVIDGLAMSHLALKYVDQISGGEYQKTQIARSVVQEPSVLVLDEPANNLDIANQHLTMQMIMGAVKSRGMCTIMTMHDINLALHYSDRFLFLNKGVVEAFGGPEIITPELIRRVYGLDTEVIEHRGLPLVVPAESAKYKSDKMTDYTPVKKMMTEKMINLYCSDVHGKAYLCPECTQMRDRSFYLLDRCIHKEEGWPCDTCPDCCFVNEDREMLDRLMDHTKKWMAEHPEQASSMAPPQIPPQ